MQRVLQRVLSAGSIGGISRSRAVSTTAQRLWSAGEDSTGADKASPDSFQRAKRGSFFQPRPQLYNTFVEDVFLRHYLTRVLPTEVRDLEPPVNTWPSEQCRRFSQTADVSSLSLLIIFCCRYVRMCLWIWRGLERECLGRLSLSGDRLSSSLLTSGHYSHQSRVYALYIHCLLIG